MTSPQTKIFTALKKEHYKFRYETIIFVFHLRNKNYSDESSYLEDILLQEKFDSIMN